jgi:predicted ArsR family transcriptional regulator
LLKYKLILKFETVEKLKRIQMLSGDWVPLELKLSRSTVKRAMADLESSEHLRKEQQWQENSGKSSNLYYIKQPDSS